MAKEAKNNKEVKNKKHFFKDFKAELKKVIWPTPKQVANSTMAVVTIVLVAAIIVLILDAIFDIINLKGFNKLKAMLREKVVVENVIENTTTEDESNEDVSEITDIEENTETDNSSVSNEENSNIQENVE